MLQGQHSAILSTFIKLPFAIKTFVLTIFECQITGFTVICNFSIKLEGCLYDTKKGRFITKGAYMTLKKEGSLQ